MVSAFISLPSMKNLMVEEYCGSREHDTHSTHKPNNTKANNVLIFFIFFIFQISDIKMFILLESKFEPDADCTNAFESRA